MNTGQPPQGPPTGFSVVASLPRRADDRSPGTPSAWLRRERFERSHPGIPITTRRDSTSLVFEVAEPGKQPAVYHDADAMMDDLEARYP